MARNTAINLVREPLPMNQLPKRLTFPALLVLKLELQQLPLLLLVMVGWEQKEKCYKLIEL